MQISFNAISNKQNIINSNSSSKKNEKKKFISLSEFERKQKLNEPLTRRIELDAFDPQIQAIRPNPKFFYKNYNGKINRGYKGPQYFCINHVRNQILFSQKTVSDFSKGKRCDYPLDFLADAMFVKFKRDNDRPGDGCLDVVMNSDGSFTSLDNRRLLIAKKIGMVDRTYGIWIRVHSPKEVLNPTLSRRFGGAKTWGQAAMGRVNNPSVKGYLNYPTIMDEGKKKNSQTIPLSIDEINLFQLNQEDVRALKRKAVKAIVQI